MQFSTYAKPAHLIAAREFLDASDFLLSAPKAREPVSRFSDPTNFLVAHGAELTLKAYLSWSGMSDFDVKALGHNLANSFQKLKTHDPTLAKAVEEEVRTKWRNYLKAARSAQVSALADYGVTSEDYLAFLGIPSNADIGEQHPTFARDLHWLSDRHMSNGGSFRYPQFGLDSAKYIQAFGLNECTVPKTVHWGCEYLLNTLDQELRKQA